MHVPGICAFTREQFYDSSIDFLRLQRLVAALAEKYCDGRTPDALPGDAPIRPRGDHVGDAFFTPRRVPLHSLDLVECALAEGALAELALHADEPLFRGAEDHRI